MRPKDADGMAGRVDLGLRCLPKADIEPNLLAFFLYDTHSDLLNFFNL